MFIATYKGADIKAEQFLEDHGANFENHKKYGTIARCLSCDGKLTLKAASSDTVSIHFSHSKKNSACPIVSIKKRKIPHLGGLPKCKGNDMGIKLRRQIAHDNELLLRIYIRCISLANWETGKNNLSVNQFCQLLILSIERNIWNLRETSITTLPYILVQLSDFPIQVAKYSIEKTDTNQFRFILALKEKQDKTKAFTNYYLHKNALTGKPIKGCNIPSPMFENITPRTINWFREKIGDQLFERASMIIL